MNYIKQLENSNAALRQELKVLHDNLHDLRAHLQSAKFQGVDLNGDRKDWIATNDVDLKIREAIVDSHRAANWTDAQFTEYLRDRAYALQQRQEDAQRQQAETKKALGDFLHD